MVAPPKRLRLAADVEAWQGCQTQVPGQDIATRPQALGNDMAARHMTWGSCMSVRP